LLTSIGEWDIKKPPLTEYHIYKNIASTLKMLAFVGEKY